MGDLIVEQIISADGYAEDAQGGIGFFENAAGLNDEDPQQLRLLQSVDAIVLGRRTYAMFAAYWPDADPGREPVAAPINALPKFVVSRTLTEAPWGRHAPATVLDGDGVASVRALRQRVHGDLIVWGSLTLADALLAAGEVDVLRLRILPILIGGGRRFTPPGLGTRALALEQAHPHPSGLVVLQYRIGAR
ncbi:MAG: reductase [Lysobacteraceae bacterium]|nr:MAG: reductase [Xanthomonadaceae bacterium]